MMLKVGDTGYIDQMTHDDSDEERSQWKMKRVEELSQRKN